jgi:hypothetical protein
MTYGNPLYDVLSAPKSGKLRSQAAQTKKEFCEPATVVAARGEVEI